MNVLKLIYLNVTFYLLFILFSTVYIPAGTLIIVFLALFASRRTSMKRFRIAISWYGFVISAILPFPLVRIEYKDDFKNSIPGPYIVVCNHRSFSDGFLVAYPCVSQEGVQVVGTWPFRMPILGPMARLAGYLSVKEMSFEEFSQKTRELLKKGISIFAFPEGSRSGGKTMRQFFSSIFRVALQTKYPIVPICISGNEHIPSRGSFLLRPGIIKIHKLPAIQWHDYKNLTHFALKNKVRDIIAKELVSMDGE